MDTYDRLRFAALVHDFGKVWNRKNHVQSITNILKRVHFLCPEEEVNDIIKIIDKTHSLGNPDADYWLLKISEKNIASVKKILWELGAVIVGAKIPQPTMNKNKCAVCLLNKKKLCDYSV
jgi:hypothetical protein